MSNPTTDDINDYVDPLARLIRGLCGNDEDIIEFADEYVERVMDQRLYRGPHDLEDFRRVLLWHQTFYDGLMNAAEVTAS